MSVETDTRDRVIALEGEVKHLTKQVDDLVEKVTAMHDLLQQAKGVRWLIVIMATIGGFLASKLGSFLPWAGK